MKKLYFLFLTTLIAFSGFSQNLAVNGSFENWTAGVPDSYDTIDFSDTDLTENTNASFVSDGSSSASVNVLTQSQGNTDIRQTIALTGGVTYTMSLDVYATNNEARARIFNGDGFSPSIYSDETILNQWQTISFEYTPGADEDFDMGIRFYDIAANWNAGTQSSLFYIDNLQVVAATEPNIAITSPADSETIPSANVDVSLSVQNFNVAGGGTGDGYIQYSVDGGSTVDKFDTSDISLTSLSEGAHTVDVELVDNSGQSLSPAATATVSFTVSTLTQVANIAALRAGTVGEFYELTGEAFLTYQQSFRNQKYIEDATGAILIDDTGDAITTTYSIGDGITGIVGELGEFGGTMQFVPSQDPGAASSTGNTLTPQPVTLAMLTANSENYESELVEVTAVTMDNTEPVFNTGTVYGLTQGGDNFNFRTSFFDADYIGGNVPSVPTDIVGIINERTGNEYFLTARDANDFSEDVLSVDSFNTNSFKVYPNPTSSGFVNIVSSDSQAISVAVYDVLGKEVINTALTNDQLNVSGLNSGVYIMKISQNNATVTKKLIIK